MRMWFSALVLLAFHNAANADTVVAARNIRSHSVIMATDLKLVATDVSGAFQSVEEIVGQETRVVVYAGRPVLVNHVGPPALVERNQTVTLAYVTGSLKIFAEGRSLGRAGVGDRVRVLNLSSRAAVTGSVQPDGTVSVSNKRF